MGRNVRRQRRQSRRERTPLRVRSREWRTTCWRRSWPALEGQPEKGQANSRGRERSMPRFRALARDRVRDIAGSVQPQRCSAAALLSRSGANRAQIRAPRGLGWPSPTLRAPFAWRRSTPTHGPPERDGRSGEAPGARTFATTLGAPPGSHANWKKRSSRAADGYTSAEARRRSWRRSRSFMWILQTRDSLRPSSSPISRRERSSQYLR